MVFLIEKVVDSGGDTVFQTGEWLQGCGEIAALLEVLRFIF